MTTTTAPDMTAAYARQAEVVAAAELVVADHPTAEFHEGPGDLSVAWYEYRVELDDIIAYAFANADIEVAGAWYCGGQVGPTLADEDETQDALEELAERGFQANILDVAGDYFGYGRRGA